MNRIQELFSSDSKPLLSVYFTAGFPHLDDTRILLRHLQQSGVSLVEIGMPFSDPLADGPVIQRSSQVALRNGMTLELLFEQLQDMRKEIRMPVLLMGYLNPVLQFGMERFVRMAAETGVDGVILPDLPLDVYEAEYAEMFRAASLDLIFLVTPETEPERLQKIDEWSTAFIYAVSSSSTTGKNTNMDSQQDYFKRLGSGHLGHPVMVGFGIRDRQTFVTATRYARGAIIGTAFIQAIENSPDLGRSVHEFISSILQP